MAAFRPWSIPESQWGFMGTQLQNKFKKKKRLITHWLSYRVATATDFYCGGKARMKQFFLNYQIRCRKKGTKSHITLIIYTDGKTKVSMPVFIMPWASQRLCKCGLYPADTILITTCVFLKVWGKERECELFCVCLSMCVCTMHVCVCMYMSISTPQIIQNKI